MIRPFQKPLNILMIDNFDSFTFNLVDYLAQFGATCKVLRNTHPISSIEGIYDGLLLSPGPGTPQNAGLLMQYLACFEDKMPILGICLGHQAIGQFYGAKLEKNNPMHGKVSEIEVFDPDYMFKGLPYQFKVVRYHSLLLKKLPVPLKITAATKKGEVMAIRHLQKNIWGLQYHPEAILSEYGKQLLFNWLTVCAEGKATPLV